MNNHDTLHKQLHDEYSPTVRRIAGQQLLNKKHVDAAIETVFTEVLRHIDALQTGPDPCAWIINKALEVVEMFNNFQKQLQGGHDGD
jgi:hypothetical protein